MPRSREAEMPQRRSPRGAPQLRPSSAVSEPLHHRRPITDRSPRLGDRQPPRGQSEPMNQKKLGTRIADLESQLGLAKVEFKVLKKQLASAEAAKKEAQEELKKKTKKTVPKPRKIPNACKEDISEHENPDDNQLETDVYEVVVKKVIDKNRLLNKPPPASDRQSLHELALKNEAIARLKTKLEEKEREIGVFSQENESLKRHLKEVNAMVLSAQAKEEEMKLRLNQLGEELVESRGDAAELIEKLKGVEELEKEMKKLRVQTEQWRKAADAAAAVLAGGGVELMNGSRIISEPQPQVDGYDAAAAAFVGDDSDDAFGTGRTKGSSGIRMLGDLWKKKGQK